MDKKTLGYAQEQLKQLRQPALSGREYENEEETICDERCRRDVTSCSLWDTNKCKLHS